ncbi:radical SAM protein [bacterium]|nr:radical SAM protein [bacterium]
MKNVDVNKLGTYATPRISAEIFDCSMPIVLDTYQICSFGCLYCFARFQNSYIRNLVKRQKVMNTKRVQRLFQNALEGIPPQTRLEQAFSKFIAQKRVIQWGGLSDPFDMFEKQYGKTLEMLEFLSEYNYPLSFSTKGTWWVYDERYRELFKKNKDNWHVKISIITLDEDKTRKIEPGVPTPKERLAALGELVKMGVNVTLRLRPFIIGVSTETWRDLIDEAAKLGVKVVTTEFLCVESRASQSTRELFKRLSKYVGYDVFEFYKKHSPNAGLMRLNFNIKVPVFKAMRDYAHEKGMVFVSSDPAGRFLNDWVNCCGVPPDWNDFKNHYGKAVLIAREKGEVKFSDLNWEWDHVKYERAPGWNRGGNRVTAKYLGWSMNDLLKYYWNNTKSWKSLRAYGLVPARKDEDGNIVWKMPEKLVELYHERIPQA